MFVPALCNSRPQKQVLLCFAFLTRFNLSGAYDVGAPNAQLCQQHMSFRVSPCLEASSAKYEVEEVEEATTQAFRELVFLLVRASHVCVAPAGQSRLR